MHLKLYRLALVCLLTLLSERAAALKLSVEPYLGYSQFNYRQTSNSETASDTKLGAIIGGKGGFLVNSKTWVALDYHLGGPYLLANNDKEFLNHMWGIGAGLISSKQRAWLGYYFSSVIDDIENGFLYNGTAFKVSLGVEFQTKLSVNFEYCMQNYREGQYRGATRAMPTLEVSVIFISLSSPIYLN